ncbi:MAG: hypothetical protein ISR83_06685 [Candidatus Marinimicrobia bacterium]|nr:hypothetical protein [Candidatus Neomarinimicrobiota bacterium]
MKKKYLWLFSVLIFLCGGLNAQQNRLFWDGRDWNRVARKVEHHPETIYQVKSAYLKGALDGKLYGYLKTWSANSALADSVFGESTDYLTTRELIKNLDYFYENSINGYIPVPAAIVIANLTATRVPPEILDQYITATRNWINTLHLGLDTLNYSRLLEEKYLKYNRKEN